MPVGWIPEKMVCGPGVEGGDADGEEGEGEEEEKCDVGVRVGRCCFMRRERSGCWSKRERVLSRVGANMIALLLQSKWVYLDLSVKG
jgi:hypothetical protein